VKIGIIACDYPHLKTEQVIQSFLRRGYQLKVYALPFEQRKPRDVLFQHRPIQTAGQHTGAIAKAHGIEYVRCENDTEIDSSCDIYHVLVGKIISAECIEGKRIINCHSGIIPAVRGLDAFNWAIYDMLPMGVTLHYIDAEVDKGEIISVVPTHVYADDTMESLARRHYENELDVIADFEERSKYPWNEYAEIETLPAHKRMGIEKQRALNERFHRYIEVTT